MGGLELHVTKKKKKKLLSVYFGDLSSCDCLGFEISWDPWGSDDEIELIN